MGLVHRGQARAPDHGEDVGTAEHSHAARRVGRLGDELAVVEPVEVDDARIAGVADRQARRIGRHRARPAAQLRVAGVRIDKDVARIGEAHVDEVGLGQVGGKSRIGERPAPSGRAVGSGGTDPVAELVDTDEVLADADHSPGVLQRLRWAEFARPLVDEVVAVGNVADLDRAGDLPDAVEGAAAQPDGDRLVPARRPVTAVDGQERPTQARRIGEQPGAAVRVGDGDRSAGTAEAGKVVDTACPGGVGRTATVGAELAEAVRLPLRCVRLVGEDGPDRHHHGRDDHHHHRAHPERKATIRSEGGTHGYQ